MNKIGRKGGYSVSEETKQKISDAMTGRQLSKQHKHRISMGRKLFGKKSTRKRLEKQLIEIQEQLDRMGDNETT